MVNRKIMMRMIFWIVWEREKWLKTKGSKDDRYRTGGSLAEGSAREGGQFQDQSLQWKERFRNLLIKRLSDVYVGSMFESQVVTTLILLRTIPFIQLHIFIYL